MATYVNTVPQDISGVTIITINQLINVLPDVLDYPINVWIGGKMVRYGKTADNLVFLTDSKDNINPELRTYFNSLVSSLGIQATLSDNWRNESKIICAKIYNNGKLIIDKNTMTYTELPTKIEPSPDITVEEVLSLLPNEIKWKETVYLTGGVVKNGFSNNDVDFIIFEITDKTIQQEIKKYFSDILKWSVDVGSYVISAREPVYLYKVYENGIRCY